MLAPHPGMIHFKVEGQKPNKPQKKVIFSMDKQIQFKELGKSKRVPIANRMSLNYILN